MIKKFVSSIDTFFRLCENNTENDNKLFDLYACLAELNYGILHLTGPDISSYDDYESGSLADDDIRPIICKSFPDLGFYWCCENPNQMENNPEFGTGDAIDDLLDIYKELKTGHEQYMKGNTKQAVSHWQLSYKYHWGKHLIDLQTVLHDMIYNPLTS